MEGLIYCMMFGGAVGFIYAWRRASKSTARALQSIAAVENGDRMSRAYTEGRIRGLQLSAGLIFGVMGAIAGAAIWGVAALVMVVLG